MQILSGNFSSCGLTAVGLTGTLCDCGSPGIPTKQVRLICVFSGLLIPAAVLFLSSLQSDRSGWEPPLPNPVTETRATASAPCPVYGPDNCCDISFLSSLKKHSGRKLILLERAPGPQLQDDCSSPARGQLLACTVEGCLHSVITQRKNPLGRYIELLLSFPLVRRWLKADKVSH